ncbi:MAG TPA: methyltransferase domain-containing protein [Usitatibacter sp.]|nr:methyltransferase domain-containing protein [Usitatibacter sp.]
MLFAQDATLPAKAAEGGIYADGTYLRNNPEWHSGDSPWKAGHIKALLDRNGVAPATVCEVGCGAGEVLLSLGRLMPESTQFFGYDISPDAYGLCAAKSGANFKFRLANLLDEPVHFDMVMAVDVFEHVEDYFGFLRKLRGKARYKVFHIPLDLSAFAVARREPLLHLWRQVGHIHQFTRDTAIAALEHTGYRIVDEAYTCGRTELPNQGWKTRLLKWPRKALHAVSPHLAARLLGGYSLLVIAE